MAAIIDRLTAEQTAQLAEFRDRWIAIGLSVEPADRPAAEAAISDMYRQAGLNAPRRIVWCGSPLSQGLVRAIVLDKRVWASVGASVWASVWASVGASVRASVGDSVWASVRDSVRASVWASVRASVWDSVWDSVRASAWDSVGASVWASVWDSVRASVWDSVRASVRDSVWASVRDSGYGQHDASWLAFYEFFRVACGLTEQTDRLDPLMRQAQSAGWYLPHEHICWVSERHCVLERDNQGRLHSVAGPACAYPDGWGIYAVHGVRVPSDIIEDRASITVARIDAEDNAEVRRVMVDLYGMDRYLTDAGARIIQQDSFGTLLRRDMGDDEPIVAVKVLNSTPEPDGSIKPYILRVPPDMDTARNAVAWTFGLRGAEYAPVEET